jgi:nucleotide-binding universal stress UspA family protein
VKRILAPTDLTCEGRNSVDYAAALASRFGGELILLHVYEAKGRPDYSADVLDDTIVDDNQQRVEDKMKEWCAEISEIHPRSNMCIRSGVPSEDIVRAARASGSRLDRHINPQASLVQSRVQSPN